MLPDKVFGIAWTMLAIAALVGAAMNGTAIVLLVALVALGYSFVAEREIERCRERLSASEIDRINSKLKG